MRLTPQRCGNEQAEGNNQDERGRDYLGNHVLADPRVVTSRSRSNTPPHEEVREVQYVGR